MLHGGFGNLGLRARVAGAALAAAITLAGGSNVHAQEVAALVNGIPITQLDIAQRQKLEQLSTQKLPPRQEVLNTLVDELLEIHEAKNFNIDVPKAEVEQSYGSVAQHMGIDSEKLTAILVHAGSSAAALKHRLEAQMAWNALIRGRYKASLEVADTDVEAQLHLHPTDEKDANVGYEYTLRPIVFVVQSGAPDTLYESRKREADALRARFADCTSGIAFARALDEVAVRDQILKFSADLPKPSRDILDGTEMGHLTPPERTAEGFQMFAVCGKRQTKNDTPEEKKVRDEMFQKKFGARAAVYLKKLRREAMIEYK
ncbi:MAG TPA: SurA N-terminal domain-containing protein [Xanthobacteraceae bacterium]